MIGMFRNLFSIFSKSKYQYLILLLSGMNLFVMHYNILLSEYFLWEKDINLFVENLFGVIFDVCILFLIFYIVTFKRLRTSLTLCFFVTSLWSLSNVVYARFFHQYISISAASQAGTLMDEQMIRYTLTGLRIYDLYYILSIIVFVYLIRKVMPIGHTFKMIIPILVLSLSLDIISLGAFCVKDLGKWYLGAYYGRHFGTRDLISFPCSTHFVRGSIRTLLTDLSIILKNHIELTEEQKKSIEVACQASRSRGVHHQERSHPQNVIIILVESLMAFVSDMEVNGKEVTPFLNALKNDTLVYYNGKMVSNVTIGESSDGQFIYMTGILPLRSSVTISRAKNITLPGLPKQLGLHSKMIIPTITSVWNQDEMCLQYGFRQLYSSTDYKGKNNGNLTDEQVFEMAYNYGRIDNMPTMTVVLTMSMHGPYENFIDESFRIEETDIDRDLACYLNACHYTDKHLKAYIEKLRENGEFDNSLIVIVADHPVLHNNFGNGNKHIPIYIINSGIPTKDMWYGECSQLDVYTTILDLMGAECKWYGLGCSLASSCYENSVSSHVWDVSEWIIMGDYFANK